MSDFEARNQWLKSFFAEQIPHNRALGVELSSEEPRTVTVRVPYSEELVGNPATGVLHGGVVTAMLDAACGAAVFLSLEKPRAIATLDLRIDYMRPAQAHHDLRCRAECYKIGRSVAFVRATAYHTDPSQLIATAAGSFMLDTGQTVDGKRS